MPHFRDYEATAAAYITVFGGRFYPDTLAEGLALYGPVEAQFRRLAADAKDSAGLLRTISDEPMGTRVQLLRIFRKYVSPITPVEMLKRKGKIEDAIRDFGNDFRPLGQVREALNKRTSPDETLAALLLEGNDRGKSGYELTRAFFEWFRVAFEDSYEIIGPEGAGPDVMLDTVLEGYEEATPADFLIQKDGQPLVVGFAHYDSDRGGSQEDDRTGGNRDKVTSLNAWARRHRVRLGIAFINDGPGLLLGSMWRDYAQIEDLGETVLVCTLKMAPERLTREWLDSLLPTPDAPTP